MVVKTADGTSTYYAGAHIDGDTLILESTFNFGSVSSANYAGVSKVSVASDVQSTSIVFDGFTSITGFRSSADKVVGTPDDANASGNNLIVTLSGGIVTIANAATSTVSFTANDTNYTAAIGEITNSTAGTVILTSNYKATSYTAAASIKSVDATTIGKAITLDGSATNGVTLLGGVGNDILTGGKGNDSLNGGLGNDLVNLSGGSATVNVSEGDDTISVVSGVTKFAVEGFSSGDAIQLDNSFSGNLSIVGGKLTLGNLTIAGISKVATNIKGWSAAGSGDFAYTSYMTSGVSLKDHKITWEAETNKETLFSITGISTITDDAVKGTVVTLGESNFAGTSIVLTDGTSKDYTLNLDKNYSVSYTEAQFGDVSNNKATYFSAWNTEGYELAGDSKVINYTAAVPIKELFELSGISNTKDIVPANSVVTVDNSNIAAGASKVAITGGDYTLKLSGVALSGIDTVTSTFGTVTNNSASYIETKKTNEFWSPTDDKTYNFTASSVVHNTLFTINGISAIDNSALSGTVVTLGRDNLLSTNATLIDGTRDDFKLALADGTAQEAIAAGFDGNIYRTTGKTDGYTLSDSGKVINYAALSLGTELFSVSSVNSTANVKYTANSGITATSEETAQLTLINLDSEKLTIDGFAKITNLNTAMHSLTGTPTDTEVDGKDLILVMAGGSVTIGGGSTETISLTDNGKGYTAEKTRITDITNENAKSVTLTTGFGDTYYGLHQSYGAGVTTVDARKATGSKLNLNGYKSTADILLIGAAEVKNSLTGGKGNDTLIGGSKDDKLKGNAGADLFVQSGGNDTITDYTGGEDIISLQSALTNTEVDDTNVTLTTAAGSIIINNGTGQSITTKLNDVETTQLFLGDAPTNASIKGDDLIVTASGKDYKFADAANDTVTLTVGDKTYTAEATRITDITNANAKSVTLTTGFGDTYYGLHQSYGAGVTTVDASKATGSKLNLNGYKSTADILLIGAAEVKNSLTGGKGNDTLIGGSKDDKLKGNAGTDLFVQSGGNDTITDYTGGEDIISLQSALTNVDGDDTNVTLTTAAGSIIINNGFGQSVTTILDGVKTTSFYGGLEPVNVTVDGEDMIVTFSDGSTKKIKIPSTETITMNIGGKIYEISKEIIRNTTDGYVTLTENYADTVYTFDDNTNGIDASNVNHELLIDASDVSHAVNIKGAEKAQNTIIGSAYDDTLEGGMRNDSIIGGDGKDLFVQSSGTDSIGDYTEEDVVQFVEAPTKQGQKYTDSYFYQNDTGTVIVNGGLDKNITTKVGEDGKNITGFYLTNTPVDVSVRSGNLVVTLADGGIRAFNNAAKSTIELEYDGHIYKADKTQLIDITDDKAHSVTLMSGFVGGLYEFDEITTKLDASKVKRSVTIDASTASTAVNIKGTDSGRNTIVGSAYDDTLAGGKLNDLIIGGGGNNLFVQTKGTDTIDNYTEGNDVIQLLSAPTKEGTNSNNAYYYQNAEGKVIVNDGSGKDITTVIGSDDNNIATTDDELWGVNGKQDIFLFDGGNDTINNYEADDTIDLNGYLLSDLSITPVVKDGNLVFTFDKENSITVSNVVSDGTAVTFNDVTTYSSDGKKLTAK